MARTLIVSDRNNSFFTANNIKVGTEIPTSGTYSKGDIVVNIGNNTATEAMWICVEAGTPGTWEVVGAGAGGGGGSIVAINDTLTVNSAVTEVSLGNLVGKISSSDKLIVHYNSTHLMEGVDYEVNSEGTRIVKLTEGSWNESGEQALFAFELFKNVESVNGNEIVIDTKLTSIVNNIMIPAPTTEVEIGVEGFDKNIDTLLVFKNGVIMVEGVDYNVNEDNTKIVSINEVWNESNVEEYGITFVVFKEVVIYDESIGGITMGMLGSDVRGTINNLTETTLQHSNLLEDMDGKYATKEDLENIEVDLSPYQQKTDNNLQTSSKNLVGAINELFQDVDSGKGIIADAIDDRNISKDSTFAAMGEAIEGIHADREEDRQKLIEILQGSNMDLTGNESMDTLLDLIDTSNLDLSRVVQMDGGSGYSFIVYNDGSVWSCGLNDYGQLGFGDTTNRAIFTQVTTNINNDVKQVACGYQHTYILKNDGSIWSCGRNNNGQLGLGTSGSSANKTTFTQVTTNINNDVKQVACSYEHTFILKNDGSIWGTGNNYRGQLGLGNTTDRTTFTQVTTNINNDAKQIACGANHTAILKNDGSVWGCGYNDKGQLGLNDTYQRNTFTQVTTNINNDVKQIDCTLDDIIILKNDGSVWGCGYNNYGQLGLGDTSKRTTFTQVTTNVKKISSNNYSTLILKNDGSLWGCGLNGGGQLGCDGDTASMTAMNKSLTQVTVNINNDVNEIFCGYNHSLIIKNDGSLWVAGSNKYGQLGLGDANNRDRFTELVNSDSLNNIISQLQTEAIVNRGSLADILTDEDVELTGDETLADLITKVDEEFDRKNNEIENSGGGLDIISATELPATGKENQICVITDNPVNDFVITSNYSDINANNTIYIFLGNSLDTTGIKGTNFDLVSNNITMKYYLLSVHQGGNKLDSYIYKNNQWTNATMSSFYIVEKGNSVNESYTGGFKGDWTVSNLNGTPCYVINIPNIANSSSNYLCYDNSTVNKINLSDYTTLEYTIASNMPDYSFAGKIYMFINNTRNVTTYVEELYRYWETPQPGSFTTYTIDISDITGEFYLGIAYIGRGYGQKLCVSDIRLY